jgi:hypothetical protein
MATLPTQRQVGYPHLNADISAMSWIVDQRRAWSSSSPSDRL